MGKLTALAVKAATAPGRYQDGGGLMLVVKPSGARSWQVRLQVDGKRRDFGLGSANDVSLAEARDKADKIRKEFRSGIDPVAKKRAERLARLEIPTFQTAAERTHAEHKAGWRNARHKGDWLSTLRNHAFPTLGNIRVDLIDGPMIRDVLLPIWQSKPVTARRVRQRITAVIGWAASTGYRGPLDLTAMSMGLPKQTRRAEHFPAMDYEAVPAFVAKVRSEAETVGRMAVLFTIYTAARSGETRGAVWEEFDLDAATWTIPAKRMKAGREHVVPLSDPALAVLRWAAQLRTGKKGEPVFKGKGGKSVSDMTMTKVLRDVGLSETVHGFRSSFKDWASEASSFPDAVSEAALAHGDPDKVRRAYRRTDFRKLRVDLMAAWAAFVDGAGCEVASLDEVRRRKAVA